LAGIASSKVRVNRFRALRRAALSRTRLLLTGMLAAILVCAALVLFGAVRAQNAPPEAESEAARQQVSQENAPAPTPEFGPNAYKDIDASHR
jgi:hypothetical protein